MPGALGTAKSDFLPQLNGESGAVIFNFKALNQWPMLYTLCS